MSYKIVVVEDDPHLLTGIADIFEMCDYSVSTFISSKTFVETFIEKGASTEESGLLPDVFLLDIMMPHYTGYELANMLRGHDLYEDIPIVFCTAKGEKDDVARGLQIAEGYVTKPFEAEELVTTIEETIQEHQWRNEDES